MHHLSNVRSVAPSEYVGQPGYSVANATEFERMRQHILLGWEQSELAEKADVSLKTVKRMEATSGPIDARSTWSVKNALEIGGIEFLDGDGNSRVRGDGVRFCKDRTGRLRRAIVEDVTGWLDVSLKLAAGADEDFYERPIEDILEKLMKDIREHLATNLQRTLHRDAHAG